MSATFTLSLSRERQPDPAGTIGMRDRLARECMAENRPRLLDTIARVQGALADDDRPLNAQEGERK